MKKLGFVFAFVSLTTLANAQQNNLIIHGSGSVLNSIPVTNIDSIKLDSSYAKFNLNTSSTSYDLLQSNIDSITFEMVTVNTNKIYIIYNGTSNATIINPFDTQGVTITANGGHVTVNAVSGISNLEYNLQGTSTDAYLTMSSDLPANLVLDNVNITNDSGAAIIITGGQTHTFTLASLTMNSLSDGSLSSKNGALQTDGNIIVNGYGTLSITGIKKHGISTTAGIELQSGVVIVNAAANDGFHSEGYIMSGGQVTITSVGDGIDAGDANINIGGGQVTVTSTSNDVKAIKTGTGNVAISGGIINYTVSGAQSKGISAKGNITISGGSVAGTLSGTVVLAASGSGFDPSYCTGIKADGQVTISGGSINLQATSAAAGARGISADGSIMITNGSVTISTAGNGATYTNTLGQPDAYTATCVKSDANIQFLGGSFTLSSTGTGGKAASADSSIIFGVTGASDSALMFNATTSGLRFLVSGVGNNADYANPKAVKAEDNLVVNSGILRISCTQTSDGGEGLESKDSLIINGGDIEISTWDDAINAANAIIINGGKTYAYAKGNDGIDCNGTLTINGGFTVSNGARNPEEGFDCDNNMFKITGGIIVGTGGNTSNPTSVSTQRSLKVSSTAGTHICVRNSANQAVLMYKIPAFYGTGSNNNVVLLFTDSTFVNGSYTLLRGGTITGGTDQHGYITGGTYSGGNSTSFTVSSYLTTVN